MYAKSDRKGLLTFLDLRPGSYLLQAQIKGYLPLKMHVEVPSKGTVTRILLREKEFKNLENQAIAALDGSEYNTAIRGFENLAAYYPLDPALRDNLARAYASILDEERALSEADLAAQFDPEFASTRHEVKRILCRNAGQTALNQRDFGRAVAKFEALKQLDPDNYEPYHGLALAYGHMGRLAEAIVAVNRAIALAPANEDLVLIKRLLEANAGQ